MRPFIRTLVATAMGLVGLLALANCADVYLIDPPALGLSLGPPPPPRITKVDVTNGAGKTVMAGRPNRDGELTANPDLADLDGTLTIKSTWSDGDVTTQTVTHTPGMPLGLTYERDRRGFVVDETRKSSATEVTPERAGD